MFFKQAYLLSILILIGGQAAGESLKDFECVISFRNDGPRLFQNTLTEGQINFFFKCLKDGAKLFDYKLFKPEDGRDYYTKREWIIGITKFVGLSRTESEQAVTKLFAFKKLLIGGEEDQLSIQELRWVDSLIYELRDMVLDLQDEFPLIRKALEGTRREVSDEEFNRLSAALQRNFSRLSGAFQRAGFSYSLKDLNKTGVYLQEAGLITEDQRRSWDRVSRILQEWGNGIFGVGAFIHSAQWDVFFRSFHSLISQALYYGFYVAGRDMSRPITQARFLESAWFFLSSLQEARQKGGFPLHNLDKILTTAAESLTEGESSLPEGSYLQTLFQSPVSRALLPRILTCFILKPLPENCSVHYSQSPSDPAVTYNFPDKSFSFYENKVSWVPNGGGFLLTPDQISHLKKWISYQAYNSQSFGEGSLPSYQARGPALSAWTTEFFGQDSAGLIRFGGYISPESSNRLIRTFMEYDALIKLFLAPYSQQGRGDSVNFRRNTFHLSAAEWEQAMEELSPALMLFHGRKGYEHHYKNRFLALRSYGDSFLNTANQNSVLDYGELMDLAFHFSSAGKQSQRAFLNIQSACGRKPGKSCAVEELLRGKGILESFPLLESRVAADPNRFAPFAKKLFPEEHINGSEDLMVFFLLIQMTETNFYFLDGDSSDYLEISEIFPLLQSLAPGVMSAIDFIHSEREALAFLTYSAQKQTLPFFVRNPKTPFRALEFAHWTLHPERWKNLKLSRIHILSLSADTYRLYF